MKTFILVVLAVILFSSCSEYTYDEVTETTKVPIAVYDTACDSTNICFIVDSEDYLYVKNKECKVIKKIPYYQVGDFLIFLIIGLIGGFIVGAAIFLN